MQQFTPQANFAVTMTGSSVNQPLGTAGSAAMGLYIYNSGTNKMFTKWGIGAQSALSDGTCFTIAPGAYFVLGKGVSDNVAIIGTSGDVAYISAGEGR